RSRRESRDGRAPPRMSWRRPAPQQWVVTVQVPVLVPAVQCPPPAIVPEAVPPLNVRFTFPLVTLPVSTPLAELVLLWKAPDAVPFPSTFRFQTPASSPLKVPQYEVTVVASSERAEKFPLPFGPV